MRTMFKTFAGRAILATAFFALAATGCSDDSSSGTNVTDDTDNSSSSTTVSTDTDNSSSSTNENAGSNESDWREHCLEIINEYRASENRAPLALADEEKQKCADEQSADDLAENKAHGHFKACGEWAQNSGPNVNMANGRKASDVAEYYLEMMWNEKKLVESGERDLDKDEDYPYIGHYMNMRNSAYTKVACGIAVSEDGTTGWFNVNFY